MAFNSNKFQSVVKMMGTVGALHSHLVFPSVQPPPLPTSSAVCKGQAFIARWYHSDWQWVDMHYCFNYGTKTTMHNHSLNVHTPVN